LQKSNLPLESQAINYAIEGNDGVGSVSSGNNASDQRAKKIGAGLS
jgi:hypothetical protein